ncbi:MAG TPA: serine/threonine-protein kinase [Blastocatellia bacterium]|nr:serine/threonine-protein kinase [Blastocatellia bacterium]
MDTERLSEVVKAALELPAAERAAVLDRLCAGDDELRREAESLLAYETTAAGFIETSAMKLAARQLAGAQREFVAGTNIHHYRLIKPLGAGGMGRVYLAEDEKLKRQVAIKFLPEAFTADAEWVRRFEQEARAASALNHPNIITIHEVGQHDQQHFIITEFIEGRTLREVLNEAKARRLDVKTTIDIAAQVAGALKAAHDVGIFHRDIKPENLMLRADGLVKVLDFGIAKLGEAPGVPPSGGSSGFSRTARLVNEPLPPEGGTPNLTAAGAILGTASYMSPEQARGKAVDGRSDLFSLGAVMYEMAMGERLFPNATPAEVTEQLLRPQEPLSSAAKFDSKTKPLEAVIRRCLRRKREQRFASAAELLGELQRLKRQLDTRFLRRVALAVSLLVVLVVAAVGWIVPASINEEWIETRMHDGHTRRVTQLALSPDGRTLISVSFDKKVVVWDLERRIRRATLTEHTGNVTAVAFSPDGKLFATTGADGDGRLIIWDAAQLTKVAVLPGWRAWSYEIAFTPNGRFLVAPSASENPRSLNIWEVGTWRKVATVPGERPIVISPDSRWLIGQDSRTFELASGKELRTGFELPGKSAFSPDGSRLAAVEQTGQVSFWDVSRFWSAAECKLIDRYPAHRDHGHAIAYSPNGRMVASASDTVIVWDARTHEKLARFAPKDTVNSLVFSHDSRQIISGHGDGTIVIWGIAEKEPLANLAEHCAPVLSANFSPDGRSVISASEDNSIIIWDAASGLKRAVLSGHRAPVRTAVFSIDGQWVLSGDLDHNLILWDAARRARLRSFAPARAQKDEFSYRAALSPDKRWIASSFGVYATDDGRTVVDFFPKAQKEMPTIHGVAFSPDGRWLACVGTWGYIALWEVAQWQPRQMLKSIGNYNAVTFAPDSRQLAIGDNDGEIALWQVEPFEKIGVLKRHTSGIELLAFTPDGRTLASAGDDESVGLWDVARRRFIGNIGRHTLPVLSVGVAPDGRLVTGEQDQTVRIYTRRRSLWGWRLD